MITGLLLYEPFLLLSYLKNHASPHNNFNRTESNLVKGVPEVKKIHLPCPKTIL